MTKVIIDKDINVNIDFGEEITLQQLNEKLFTISKLVKSFSGPVDVLAMTKRKYNKTGEYSNKVKVATKEKKTRKKLRRRDWVDTREKAVKILKLHYFGTKETKEQFAKSIDRDWQTDVVKSLWAIRNRYKIQSKEIGLRYWPSGKGRHINIDQAKI